MLGNLGIKETCKVLGRTWFPSHIVHSSRRCSTVTSQSRRANVAGYSPLGHLVSQNRIPEAIQRLEDLLDKSRRVHALAVGDLLEALCKQGKHETAWRLLRRLSNSKARLPLPVLHRLLKIAGQNGSVSDVLAVYDHQQQYYGFASTAVQTTLIHALLKAHSKALPGNLLAYEAWVRLKTSGRQLDAQALLAGIHAATSVGRDQEAKNILLALKEMAGAVGRPVVSGYNIIMKAYAATGDFEAARKLFAMMKSLGVTPDTVTYNTLLASFVQAGELIRARAVLEKMKREGVRPDEYSYTTYALGLGQQGQLQEMGEVWREMKAAGVPPNTVTHAVNIDALATAGQVTAAQSLLQDLLQQQQLPWCTPEQQQQIDEQRDDLQQVESSDATQQQQEVTWQQSSHSSRSSEGQQQQQRDEQQPQSVISERVLRHLFNMIIQGHLQTAAVNIAAGGVADTSSFRDYQALLGTWTSPQSSSNPLQHPTAGTTAAEQWTADTAVPEQQEQRPQQQPTGYSAAVIVLKQMSELGIAPGVDTYTLFINHAIQVGDQQGVQLLLQSLAAADLEPDQVLLTCLIKAAGQAGDHAAALELFDAVVAASVPTSGSSSSSTDGVGSSGGGNSGRTEPGMNGIGAAMLAADDVPAAAQRQQQQQGSVLSPAAKSSNRVASSANSQQQQQQQRKGFDQQLLPLTASAGPDPAAWNALAAVLVQTDRLADAAAAVDRAAQASQAAGLKKPPVEGFAVLIRGYRNAGAKGKAVAALRQFLSLGGRPERVVCNDVIAACLRDDDLKTARQVVRAMELTGSTSSEDIRDYEAWFSRWEARKHAAAAGSVTGGSAAAAGGSSGGSMAVQGAGPAAGAGQAAVVERLKWWLGLPNNYYYAGDASAHQAGRKGSGSVAAGGALQQKPEDAMLKSTNKQMRQQRQQ